MSHAVSFASASPIWDSLSAIRRYSSWKSGYLELSKLLRTYHHFRSESQQLLNILLYRFGDGKGVNYVEFLEQLQPTETLEDKHQTRMAQLSTRRTTVCTNIIETLRKHYYVVAPVDADSVLEKIKTKVYTFKT